jgi:hypothetical protein
MVEASGPNQLAVDTIGIDLAYLHPGGLGSGFHRLFEALFSITKTRLVVQEPSDYFLRAQLPVRGYWVGVVGTGNIDGQRRR